MPSKPSQGTDKVSELLCVRIPVSTPGLVAAQHGRPKSITEAYPYVSYYDRKGGQQPALIRARRPYLVKNLASGMSLLAFSIAVCTMHHHIFSTDSYTMYKIGQDDFKDVKVPEAPRQTVQGQQK